MTFVGEYWTKETLVGEKLYEDLTTKSQHQISVLFLKKNLLLPLQVRANRAHRCMPDTLTCPSHKVTKKLKLNNHTK